VSLAPECRAFLAACAAETPRVDWASGVEAMRRANVARELRYDVQAPAMWREHSASIAADHGAEVSLDLYVPKPPSAGPLGVLLFLHGGGWVMCSPASHANMCRYLCARAGVIGVNVGYRLAPEHRFPAAHHDVAAALDWIFGNIADYGGDGARIAVAGDSAGGNLAAVLAQAAACGEAPRLAAQALFYPSVAMGIRERFASWNDFGGGEYGLSDSDAEWMTGLYLERAEQRFDTWFNPILADRLEGAAPALIISAECDPLRDEGQAYAARLAANGVRVEAHCFPGMIHAFMSMAGAMPTAYRALDLAGDFIAAHAGGGCVMATETRCET